jgi:TRAP-type C4-dicarboxylate transport system permease small subunit
MDLFWQAANWHEQQSKDAASRVAAEALAAPPRIQTQAPAGFVDIALGAVDRLTRFVALYCGGILLFVLMSAVIIDVTGRYLFNHPLYGSLDISITLLVLVVAASIGYGGRTGAHVTADIFTTLVGPFVEWITAIFVKFFAAAIVALWCWRLFVTGQIAARLGETTLLLNIPFQPIYLVLSFGIGLYALVLFFEGLMLIVKGGVPLLSDESRIVMNTAPIESRP